jgi:phage N-6-adenine-methyltransferase
MPGNQLYRTPPGLFELIQRELKLRFKLDAAADAKNTLCKRFHDEQANGLTQPWSRDTWCNPPFARFGRWIEKAYRESCERDLVACVLGPAGACQKWFHETCPHGTVFVPDQRIAYVDPDTGEQTPGARGDSMIYVFGREFSAQVPSCYWHLEPFHIPDGTF